MKKYFTFIIFIFLIFASSVQAVDLGTTGFISGSIWYSKSPLAEGETVKVYTALWNNNSSSLSAKIEFYDKNVILGSRDIVVPSLQLQETYISWKVTAGDHLISAKIISPTITASGKKQAITLDNSTTEISRTFVPVVLTTTEGKTATSSDVIKSQLDKATSSLDGLVPSSISTPVSENVGIVDSFRANTFKQISDTKIATENKLKELNNPATTTSTVNSNKKINEKVTTVKNNAGIENATEKPITYLKLFFFTILSFIFGSKLVFYALIVLVIFLVTRGIYRKIRNR